MPRLSSIGNRRNRPAAAENAANFFPSSARAAWTSDPHYEKAPEAYIRRLFDHYAPHFNGSLAQLQYRAPALIAERLAGAVAPNGSLDILDAGCGTGLCGPDVERREAKRACACKEREARAQQQQTSNNWESWWNAIDERIREHFRLNFHSRVRVRSGWRRRRGSVRAFLDAESTVIGPQRPSWVRPDRAT